MCDTNKFATIITKFSSEPMVTDIEHIWILFAKQFLFFIIFSAQKLVSKKENSISLSKLFWQHFWSAILRFTAWVPVFWKLNYLIDRFATLFVERIQKCCDERIECEWHLHFNRKRIGNYIFAFRVSRSQ